MQNNGGGLYFKLKGRRVKGEDWYRRVLFIRRKTQLVMGKKRKGGALSYHRPIQIIGHRKERPSGHIKKSGLKVSRHHSEPVPTGSKPFSLSSGTDNVEKNPGKGTLGEGRRGWGEKI